MAGKKILVLVLSILCVSLLSYSTYKLIREGKYKGGLIAKVFNPEGLLDDWIYSPSKNVGKGMYSLSSINKSTSSYDSFAANESTTGTIGFSTGGAKDINNYRDNLKEGYFPLLTDITYEGLFYDYYFDTSTTSVESNNTDSLFIPTASTAVSADPVSGENDYYITVGLNSNIKQSDFARKKLNLVVVLDISGSMSSPITDYYYDEKPSEKDKTKMKLAEEAVNILIDQLKDYDSLGIVLFDDSAYLAKPLNKVCDVDMSAIKRHMLEVDARGGTNFEAGYKLALDLFDDYDLGDASAYENRIIVITDAMPNIGSTSSSSLLSMMKDAQKDNINTTFIGVGVDFNTEVVKNISNVRGANYYKVSSEEEFKTRMGEQFDYMVTPMIYDLSMTLEGDSYELVKLYGTDDIDSENSNTVMHVNTLFPSSTNSSGEVKGGVILLRLKKLNDNGNLSLKMSWEEVSGKKGSSSLNISFKDNATYYDNTGIRKAIVLTRYANTVKNWISYERTDDDRYLIIPKVGIFDFVDYDTEPVDNNYYGYYSDTERTSVPLTLDDEYKTVFTTLKSYMEKEIEGIGDTTMQQEIEMLDIILAANK